MAKVGEVAEGELDAIRQGFHSEASSQAAVTLWVHQGKPLKVPRSKVGGDLAAGGGQGVSLGAGVDTLVGDGTWGGVRTGMEAC